jgi:hypothetical protein
MNRLTQQSVSSGQTDAINNLKDKTKGLSYENDVAGLTGSSGGFLSGKKKAMRWDAQGNLVIEGKVQFSGADLQTTLDGKQPKGDYVMTPAFNTYKQNTVEVLKKLQPKGDYALRDELTAASRVLKGDIGKVSDSLSGYQRKGDYAVTKELDNYQRKGDYALRDELAKLQPKGNYASVDALSTFQPKGNYVNKNDFDDEFKKFAKSTESRFVSNDELKKFAQSTDARFVSNPELNTQLKKYALLDELKKYVSADELKKYVTPESLKNFASLDELKKYAPVSELQQFASLNELKKFALADELKKYALLTDVTKYVSIDELKKYATIDSLKDLSSLKASVDAISKVNLQELSAKINSQDLSKYALKSDLSGLQQSNIFSKLDAFDKPAIQLGATNDAKDTNIYSLSFGKAEGGTYTGMGLVPNDKKAFPNTTGPILGTHIKAQNEYGIFSDGWDKLFAVQGGSGNVKVKGTLDASGLTIGGKPIGSGAAAAFDGAMSDKQLRLRGPGDPNHYVAYAAPVDGVRVQGHQGGQLGTNLGGDKTALSWNADGDINIARNATLGDNLILGGDNSWILHTPDDGRKQLYVAPRTADKKDWDWSKQTQFMPDGSIIAAGRNILGEIDELRKRPAGSGAASGPLKISDKWMLQDENGVVVLRNTTAPKDSRYAFFPNEYVDVRNATAGADYNKQVDFVLGKDAAPERGPVGPARALVRDGGSALTINYADDFAGGVNLNAKGGFRVAGNANINGAIDAGAANFRGGVSVHNPEKWGTHFPWRDDNKNYIRGDTELRGNLNNIGDLNVGGQFTVGGKPLNVGGPAGIDYNKQVDFVLGKDAAPERGPVGPARALVRDGGSSLTINYAGDFKGGVNVQGPGLNVDGNFTVKGKPIVGGLGPQGPAGPAGPQGPPGPGGAGAAFNGAMSDKQLRLRGPDDPNHYVAYTGAVDGARVQGHSGGQLGTNKGGDKTALAWNADGSVIINPAGLRVSDPNDWMRIVGSDKNGVALYNGLSVNDNGGINVGEWARVPQGMVKSNSLNVRGNGPLQFGDGFDREVNAGQISYGMHDGRQDGTLNIVGAGKNGQPRMVNVWESLRTTQALGVGDMPRDFTGLNIKRRDGRWSHLDWKDDGKNYIRGDTIVDGASSFNGQLNVNGNAEINGRLLPKYTHSPYTDAGGNDIRNMNGNWFECKQNCDGDANCKGFNFQAGGWPNGKGSCWLKNNVVNKTNTGDWHLFTKNY